MKRIEVFPGTYAFEIIPGVTSTNFCGKCSETYDRCACDSNPQSVTKWKSHSSPNFPPVVLESDWMAIRLFQLKKIASKVLSALDGGQPAISVLIIVVLAMLQKVFELLWQN